MFKIFISLKIKINESDSAWEEKRGRQIENIQKLSSIS